MRFNHPSSSTLSHRSRSFISGFLLAVAGVYLLRTLMRFSSGAGNNRHPSYVEPDDYNSFPERTVASQSTTSNSLSDHGQHYSELLSMVSQKADNNGNIIVVYSSYSYREPLLNWLIAMQKARGSPTDGILLICLDQELVDVIQSLGWDCYKQEISKSSDGDSKSTGLDKDTVKSLWVTRVNHILAILRSGVNVILSDTDAIWLRDASEIVNEGDIVASKANFPYDSPWGATLCMGLIFLRSTPEVIKVTEKALEFTVQSQDDQIGFNHALFALPFEDLTGKKRAFGRRISPSGDQVAKATFFVDRKPLKMTILPHPVVPRYCGLIAEDKWNEVVVAHCHVNEGKPAPTNKHKGNQATHSAVLTKYGLNYLTPGWDTLLTDKIKEVRNKKPNRATFADVIKSLSTSDNN